MPVANPLRTGPTRMDADDALVQPSAFRARPAPLASGAPRRMGAPLHISTALPWACLIAIGASTQYLFQPFVWANWPWDEVLVGWLEVASDRVVVATSIALALVAASRIEVETQRVRAALLAGAIIVGALAGETILFAAGSPGERVDLRSALGRALHWGLLAGCILAMHYLWQRNIASRASARSEELRLVQAERQLVETQLQVLRTQIEPHFLFNTLATVRRLHHAEPAGGVQLLRDLIDYLSMTISSLHDSRGTLRREVELVRAYLGVVTLRMSGRLRTCCDIPEDLLDCEFPPLALATLVENAVKHGIGPKLDGGTIAVCARRDDDALEVIVTDTGAGFSGMLGTGIGLANIRARLSIQYGSRGLLRLQENKPCGVRAMVRIPCLPRS